MLWYCGIIVISTAENRSFSAEEMLSFSLSTAINKDNNFSAVEHNLLKFNSIIINTEKMLSFSSNRSIGKEIEKITKLPQSKMLKTR